MMFIDFSFRKVNILYTNSITFLWSQYVLWSFGQREYPCALSPASLTFCRFPLRWSCCTTRSRQWVKCREKHPVRAELPLPEGVFQIMDFKVNIIYHYIWYIYIYESDVLGVLRTYTYKERITWKVLGSPNFEQFQTSWIGHVSSP